MSWRCLARCSSNADLARPPNRLKRGNVSAAYLEAYRWKSLEYTSTARAMLSLAASNAANCEHFSHKKASPSHHDLLS